MATTTRWLPSSPKTITAKQSTWSIRWSGERWRRRRSATRRKILSGFAPKHRKHERRLAMLTKALPFRDCKIYSKRKLAPLTSPLMVDAPPIVVPPNKRKKRNKGQPDPARRRKLY